MNYHREYFKRRGQVLKPSPIETQKASAKVKNSENIDEKHKFICYSVAGVSGSRDWKDAIRSKLRKNAVSTK